MAKQFGWMGPSGWLPARSQICESIHAAMVESLLLPLLAADLTAEADQAWGDFSILLNARVQHWSLSSAETNGKAHGARPSLGRQCGSSAPRRVARPTRVVRSDW
jgi:hypothetical protein